MHHASRITQPSGKHRKKKLILCHVTSDMPVTQVTPGKPRKFKIQVQSSKSCVAVWGLRFSTGWPMWAFTKAWAKLHMGFYKYIIHILLNYVDLPVSSKERILFFEQERGIA